MWIWIPVVTNEIELCSNCQAEFVPWSKGYIKVWWPYKEHPELSYFVCARCGPQPA